MKAEELRQKMQRGEDVMMLDVREPDEFAAGDAIEGSQNMPMGKVFREAASLPKDKKIVAICKSGGRCDIVARELSEKGYDIEALEGGISAWKLAQAAG
jgi:rhodanese-related sulfurtransferase